MDNINGLALARIGLGLGFYATPELALKYGMLDPQAPQSPYLGRMFAAREIALGLVTLLAKPESKRGVIALGLAVDLADSAAGALAIRSKAVSTKAGAVLTGTAALAALTGLRGLGQYRAVTAG